MKRVTAVLALMMLAFSPLGGAWAGQGTWEKHGAMRMDGDQFARWVARHMSAPKAHIDPEISKRLSGLKARGAGSSIDLLQYLNHVPSEREQGKCGNCWVWASTTLYEVMLGVAKDEKQDRLSIQYTNSCKTYDSGERCACCGGDLATFVSWYNSRGKTILWSNTNASYADASRTCSDAYVCTAAGVSCGTIDMSSEIKVGQYQADGITTHGVGSGTAIDNVKNVLNQKKAVEFSFALANSKDWDAFDRFWTTEDETALWHHDRYCGKTYDPTTGVAHAMVLVGYNDTSTDKSRHYWVILNSAGTADGKRPNGVFRMPMYMNYDCTLTQEGQAKYVMHFENLAEKVGKSLTVNLKGTGAGTVTSNPAGINCTSSQKVCSASFTEGTTVTLTARATSSSTFAGWSGGGCSGKGACTVTLDEDVDVTDEFDTDCTYDLSKASQQFPWRGGSLWVGVTADGGDECPSPEVRTTAPWIKTKASLFADNRGAVLVTAIPNETRSTRSAPVTIGGRTFTVSQAAVACQISTLRPPLRPISAPPLFRVSSPSSPMPACPWIAEVDNAAKDLAYYRDGASSGTGTGRITYSVTVNDTGKARTGRITVSVTGDSKKKIFTVTQAKK